MEAIPVAGLPETMGWRPGRLTIMCRDMEHLGGAAGADRQGLDSDYAARKAQGERPLPKKAQMETGDLPAPAAS
jgi:hypothetical protein